MNDIRKCGVRILLLMSLVIVMMIIMTANARALGIAPSMKIINYDIDPQLEGQVETVNARIINTDSRDITLKIQANGELSEYVTIPQSTIHLSSSDSEKEFTYYINLPKGLEPGVKTLYIMASEVNLNTDNALGGMMTITQQVHVNVPYDGLYAEGYVSISASGPEYPVVLAINIINSGTKDIGTLKGVVAVRDTSGKTVYSENISGYNDIGAGSSFKIENNAELKDNGEYAAEYTIYYDEKNFTVSKGFTLGDYGIAVLGADVENFRIGTVARFDINISSGWNTPIEKSYGEVVIKDNDGKIVGTARTDDVSIMPNNNSLKAYWDTENISSGNYVIGISIHAGGAENNIAAKEYPSTIEDDKIIIGSMPEVKNASNPYKIYIASILAVIALILIIALFRKSRRRRN